MASTDITRPQPPAQQAVEACVNAAPRLPAEQAAAWVGFLAAHADITRGLDAGLNAEFGLSLSALEVMARMAYSGDAHLRMSDLAEGALLSQSRVSRLVDQLEGRGLVRRFSCPNDSRVVYAGLTDAGHELIGRALEFHWLGVQERFFASLSETQVRELGEVFKQILGAPASPDTSSCTGG